MMRLVFCGLAFCAAMCLSGCDDFSHNAIVNTPPVNFVNLLMTKTYGGDGYDWGTSLTKTADGEYLITGSTTSNGYGENSVYLAKIDPAGEQVWYIWCGGWGEENGLEVALSPDSTIVVAGGTTSFDLTTGHKIDSNEGKPYDELNFYLTKTTMDGIIIWEKPFGDTLFDEAATGLVVLDDGYLMAGYQYRSGSRENFFFIRTNLDGDTLWQRGHVRDGVDMPESFIKTSDGGFVAAGHTSTVDRSKSDPMFVKIDGTGSVIWEKTHGDSILKERIYSIVEAGNGDLVATGAARPQTSYEPTDDVLYVVRVTASGDLVWENVYEQSGVNEGRAVLEDQYGNLIICGQDAARNAIQIAKIGGNGDFIWADSTGALGYAMDMIAEPTGYAITGSNQFPNHQVYNDVLLLRVEEDKTNVE